MITVKNEEIELLKELKNELIKTRYQFRYRQRYLQLSEGIKKMKTSKPKINIDVHLNSLDEQKGLLLQIL